MENLNLELPQSNTKESSITTDEFQLDMVDFGSAYQGNEDIAVACLSCYCGSGCLCGCVNQA